VSNLLDGVLAKDYYSDNDASTYIVNPNNGRRFSDNKIWGSYIIGNRHLKYIQWNSTSTSSYRAYYRWYGENDCRNGWKPWENFSKYSSSNDKYRDNYYKSVPISLCNSKIGTYYIYNTDWH